MNSDYRLTEDCETFDEIKVRKAELSHEIKANHPKSTIEYNRIRDRTGQFFERFAHIYHKRCAYCGITNSFLDIHLFEIDHYICKSAFDSHAEAGRVSNLVFSCYPCNRPKRDFLITKDYEELLNPDSAEITNVFLRDSDYYIRISPEFQEDEFIREFYTKLKFESHLRRLDHLLIQMQKLAEKIDNETLKCKLEACINQLMMRKNSSYAIK